MKEVKSDPPPLASNIIISEAMLYKEKYPRMPIYTWRDGLCRLRPTPPVTTAADSSRGMRASYFDNRDSQDQSGSMRNGIIIGRSARELGVSAALPQVSC